MVQYPSSRFTLLSALSILCTSDAFTPDLIPRQKYFASPMEASKTTVALRPASTCLFAEEGDAEGEHEPRADEPTPPRTEPAADILNSPDFLKRKLEVLKSDIEQTNEMLINAEQRMEEGKAEWGGQLEDLRKEYQNIQERMNAQSKKGDSQATVAVVREMLKVLDNFDRAFGAVKPESDSDKAIEAEYKGTYDMILNTFKQLGVEEIETLGVEFDYEVHQAVMQRPSEDYDEGIVCDELQKGFKLGDQLIRAAMVSVAA